MKRFAQNTRVPIERSRAEIERVITRYGATGLAVLYTNPGATMVFDYGGHRVRFVLPAPDPHLFKRQDAYDKEHRRLWRAFALVIKAQLEAVASGVFTFEDVFLAHILAPGHGGLTFGQVCKEPVLVDRSIKMAQLKAAAS